MFNFDLHQSFDKFLRTLENYLESVNTANYRRVISCYIHLSLLKLTKQDYIKFITS